MTITSVRQPSLQLVGTTLWPARRSPGGDAALWAGGVLALLALVSVGMAATREPDAGLLLLAILAMALGLAGGALLVWAIGYRRLGYLLTRDALLIDWLGTTVVVPYPAIDGIFSGQRLVGNASPAVPHWPGIYIGPGRARGIGRLRFFATSPDPSALTLITVEGGGVVVSARNPQEFRSALIQRVQDYGEVSPGDPSTWTEVASRRPPWTALTDRWLAGCVAAALLLLLVMLALLAFGIQGLPDQIPLRFDASGRPSQMGPRGDLLRLPLVGFLSLVVNAAAGAWLHARERLLARVLWVGAATVQAVLVVAVIRLLQ